MSSSTERGGGEEKDLRTLDFGNYRRCSAVAAIAYGVYRFFTPDYLEDFEDDFDDDFDDDFFEDEDEEMPVRKTEAKEEKSAE